ncbi:hypothetical protein ABW19_dt0201266 [Dactylella cylindrospora]|nr:hypothetical protein ABW19_dt0201266 [Dactylella cylindrospora]
MPPNSLIRKFSEPDFLDCLAIGKFADGGSSSFVMALPGRGRVDYPDCSVGSATFSPDGSKVAVLSGRWAKIWDTKTGELVSELKRRRESGRRIAFSSNGDYIIVFNGYSILNWDFKSGSVKKIPRIPVEKRPEWLRSADPSLISYSISSSGEGSEKEENEKKGETEETEGKEGGTEREEQEIEERGGEYEEYEEESEDEEGSDDDGNDGDGDGDDDIEDYREDMISALFGWFENLTSDALEVDWKRNAMIYHFSANTFKLGGFGDRNSVFAFSNGGSRQLMATSTILGETITIWDVSTEPSTERYKVPLAGGEDKVICKLKFSAEDRELLCVSTTDKGSYNARSPMRVSVIDVETGELMKVTVLNPVPYETRAMNYIEGSNPNIVIDITARPGGNLVLAAMSPPAAAEPHIAIWDVSTRMQLGTILLHNSDECGEIQLSNDGSLLLVSGEKLSLWKVPTPTAGESKAPALNNFNELSPAAAGRGFFKLKSSKLNNSSIEIYTDGDDDDFPAAGASRRITARFIEKKTKNMLSEIIVEPFPTADEEYTSTCPDWYASPMGDIVAFVWQHSDQCATTFHLWRRTTTGTIWEKLHPPIEFPMPSGRSFGLQTTSMDISQDIVEKSSSPDKKLRIFPSLFSTDGWITWKGMQILKVPESYVPIGEGGSKVDADTNSVSIVHRGSGNTLELKFDPEKLDSLLKIK